MAPRDPYPPPSKNCWSTRPRVTFGAGLLLALVAACGPAEPPPPPDVYETRGVVRQLPSLRFPGSALQIRHEPLPEFRDADGEVVGMESMTMPFAIADEALLEGVAVGDKVAVTLEVRWQGGEPLRITGLEMLPSETVLAFEPTEDPPQEPQDEMSGAP